MIRTNYHFVAPNIAAACSAHEDEKQRKTIEFDSDVEFEISLNNLRLLVDPEQWVIDHVADPVAELAIVYKQIAIYIKEPSKMAQALRNVIDNKIREISEHEVEKKW